MDSRGRGVFSSTFIPSAPILHTLDASRDAWVQKIENSYLTTPAKAGYLEILSDRRSRLFG